MDHPALRVVNQALLYTNSMRIHTMMREMHVLVFMYLRDAYYTLWGNHITLFYPYHAIAMADTTL